MSLIAKAVTRILSDIEPFSRHVLNRPLRPYQLAPARAILDSILHQRGDTFAVVMARQAGKNETAAQIEAYLLNLFQRAGGSIVKASPTLSKGARVAVASSTAASPIPSASGPCGTGQFPLPVRSVPACSSRTRRGGSSARPARSSLNKTRSLVRKW